MKISADSSRLNHFLDNPRKGLWSLAVPMMLGMAIHTAYMLVDMIFVGRVSAEALTALSFNVPLVFFVFGVTFGLGSGATAVVAQAIGRRNKADADNSANHSIAVALVMAVVFTGGGLLFGRGLLRVLGVPPEFMDLAWGFFRIIALGFPFMIMSVFFRSILSGEGNMRTPVMIEAGGTILNIILDPIFIFTLGYGLQGAAIATVISQVLATTAFLYILFVARRSFVTLTPRAFRPDGKILRSILWIGAPASFSFLAVAIGSAIYNRILIDVSPAYVAGYQVGTRLDHVFALPMISIATGLVTLIGMFYGAGRHDLVRQILRYALGRGVLIAGVLMVVFFVFAPQIAAGFTPDEEIRQTVIGYLRIIAFAYPPAAISVLIGRALQGMGHGTPMLVLTLLRVFLIAAPMAWLFVHRLGWAAEWAWGSILIAALTSAIIAWRWMAWGLSQLETPLDLDSSDSPATTAI